MYFPPSSKFYKSSFSCWIERSLYLHSSLCQLCSVNCNIPLQKGMLSKDFRHRLRPDTQKLINSFLLFFLHTGSYPTSSVHLKFSYHAMVCFAVLCMQGNVQPGPGGLWARRFGHAFGIFVWSVETRLEPGAPALWGWCFSLAAVLQANEEINGKEAWCGK